MADVVVEQITVVELEQLRGLWLELLEHHSRISPATLPGRVDDEVSWQRRSDAYRRWLEHPRAFCLVARGAEGPLGYALVSIEDGEVLNDTWASGPEVAELQTLVVSERARSAGLGARLLHAAEAETVRRGIEDMLIAAVATNERAVAFYEGHGYVPFITQFHRRLAVSS